MKKIYDSLIFSKKDNLNYVLIQTGTGFNFIKTGYFFFPPEPEQNKNSPPKSILLSLTERIFNNNL